MSSISASHRKFLFIAGLHRSGTSIIHESLRLHPEISGFHDTGAPEDEGQHLQTVFPRAAAYGGPGRFGFASEAHLTEASRLVSPESRIRLWKEWSKYWDLTKPVLIEKSPPNLLRTRFLQACFEQAYFLIVVRHPIATAYATRAYTTKRIRFWNRVSVESQIDHWFRAYEIFKSDQSFLKRCMVLRYEDFADDALAQLRVVCDFVGIAPISADLSVRAGANSKYFEQYREDLRGSRGKVITDRARTHESTALSFGYSLVEEPFVRPLS